MPGIFISYRRESTAAFAGRLFDRLSLKFGKEHTFMDVDGIEPGEDFTEVLESRLADTVALVVLIDRDWLNCKDARGRTRLQNPDDFVRLEVATALRRNVRVIPVLLEDAPMPTSEELPPDLALLGRRQAIELSHTRFHQDVARLVDVLERLLLAAEGSPPQHKSEADRTANGKPVTDQTGQQEKAALEQSVVRDRAEAARLARAESEAERIARDKAVSEAQRARWKAEADLQVRDRDEAARIERAAKEKAEESKRSRWKAEAEQQARDRADAARISREKEAAEENKRARWKAEAEQQAQDRAEAARVLREKKHAKKKHEEKKQRRGDA